MVDVCNYNVTYSLTLARSMGWEWAFIIIGVLGYGWMGLWIWLYEKPSQSKHVNKAELTYIEQDENLENVEAEKTEVTEAVEEKTIGFLKCFSYRQTWSFIVGKLMTDGLWWFILFWAPAYFSDQYGYSSDSGIILVVCDDLSNLAQCFLSTAVYLIATTLIEHVVSQRDVNYTGSEIGRASCRERV